MLRKPEELLPQLVLALGVRVFQAVLAALADEGQGVDLGAYQFCLALDLLGDVAVALLERAAVMAAELETGASQVGVVELV